MVIYDLDLGAVERAAAEFYKVFSVHDAELYDERYNLLNAFLAAVPGNHAFNLRTLYLLNTNYADYSFLFTLHSGRTAECASAAGISGGPRDLPQHAVLPEPPLSRRRAHHDPRPDRLGQVVLIELPDHQPAEIRAAHLHLRSGRQFRKPDATLRRFLRPRRRCESAGFSINPFSLPPTKENLDFLTLFVQGFAARLGNVRTRSCHRPRDLRSRSKIFTAVDPSLRTLGVLANTLPHVALRASRQMDARRTVRISLRQRGGHRFLFAASSASTSSSMSQVPGASRTAAVLHPASRQRRHCATAPSLSVFKAFFIDEAWVFLRNPSIQRYVVEALKTWRKHNAAMILSTQSLDELRRSDLLDVILESCATKIFLANPDMDRDLYRKQFHLNETEIELIAGLLPKQQFLIKTPELAKVANLSVDRKSYWLYTNDPYDNRKRAEAFDAYGFEKGLEVLAGAEP